MSIEHQSGREVLFERERGVYAIRSEADLAHLVVQTGDSPGASALSVFRSMAEAEVPIFLIKLHRTAVTFGLYTQNLPRARAAIAAAGLDCKVRENLALVTVVANNMRDLTGVLVSIADALAEAGARVHAIGDSHNSVQCLIDQKFASAAVACLNGAFGLDGSNG